MPFYTVELRGDLTVRGEPHSYALSYVMAGGDVILNDTLMLVLFFFMCRFDANCCKKTLERTRLFSYSLWAYTLTYFLTPSRSPFDRHHQTPMREWTVLSIAEAESYFRNWHTLVIDKVNIYFDQVAFKVFFHCRVKTWWLLKIPISSDLQQVQPRTRNAKHL